MISETAIDAYNRAYQAVWKERAPVTQGEATAVERAAVRAGLAAALPQAIGPQEAVTARLLDMYRQATADQRDRRLATNVRSALGHQALARIDVLYASATARKVAAGQVLQLLGVDPHQPAGQDVPAEDPRPGG